MSSEGLPEGWLEVDLGVFIETMANGVYKPEKFYAPDGVPCLRMYNIQDGHLVWENVKRMRLTSREVEQYRLLPGDILINRVNSRELVGKAAICDDLPEPTVFESKNIRLRLQAGLVEPKYVNYLLLASDNRTKLSDSSKQTVGMATVSQPQIESLLLPFPPLPEQRRIVAKIDALLAQLRIARQRLIKAARIMGLECQLRNRDSLTQAVLAKAFRGELVPTEAELARRERRDYEPASALLERIRAERTTSGGNSEARTAPRARGRGRRHQHP
jgi:type I restriction enzyme S subunit